MRVSRGDPRRAELPLPLPQPISELVAAAIDIGRRVDHRLQALHASYSWWLTPQPGTVWAEILEAARDGRLAAALDDLGEGLRAMQEQYEASPFAFVLELTEWRTARLLLDAVDEHGEAVMLAVMERALLDPEHLDLVVDAAAQAEILDAPQRADLLAGVEALRACPSNWTVAARLLLGAYEGALWLWAQADNVIDDQRQLTSPKPGRPGYARAISRLLEEDALPLPDEERRYVSHTVFNQVANDIRHGRARAGHRETTIVLLWALDAWLTTHSSIDLERDASRRVDAFVAQLLDATNDDAP